MFRSRRPRAAVRPSVRRPAPVAPPPPGRGFEPLESRVLLSSYFVSTGGSDSAAGTQAAPFRTLQRAVDAVAPGDEIVLRGGSYAGGVTVRDANVTIRSFQGERASITAPYTDSRINDTVRLYAPGCKLLNLDISGGYYYAVKLESEWGFGNTFASNTLIDGCAIHDSGRDNIKITPNSNHVTIRNSEIYNSGLRDSSNAEGIDNVNGDNMVVQDNYIHDTATQGVYAKGGASGAVIERNRFENIGRAAVTLGFYTDAEFFDADNPLYYESIDGVVRNNVIVNSGYSGIGLYGALRPRVYNNTLINVATGGQAGILVAPSEVGSVVTPSRDVSVYNNIVVTSARPSVQIRPGGLAGTANFNHNWYRNSAGTANFRDDRSGFQGGLSAWRTRIGGEANSREGNPLLAADGHLASTSPAIDAGADLSSTGFADDFDRQSRPAGAWDVGADEFNGGTTPAPDTTAPAISGVSATGVSGSAATVNWATNEPADGRVEYGTTTAYGSTTPLDMTRDTTHAATLTGLRPSTTYHYRVLSRDAAGNLATSPNFTFTTAAAPAPATVYSPVAYYGDFDNYTPVTASRWSVAPEGGDTRLFINTSDIATPVEDVPGEYALVDGRTFGDFDMTFRARSNEDLAANPSADYIVVFGYTDRNNYSYLMMSGRSTNTRLFRVADGVPTPYPAGTAAGVPDAAWHSVRVTRSGTTLTASVDGRTVLSTTDAAFGQPGAVGLGSYNDSVYFDELDVAAPAAPAPLPTVQVASSAYSAAEGAGSIVVTVTRSGDTTRSSTVAYATANGTAAAGSDYVATSGTLSFAAGETSKAVAVQLLDDATVEPNETLTLTLSSPSGATLGSPQSATLTITNDDAAPVPASAAGLVFDDSNGNGVREAAEAGLAGVTVFLDADRDGALDAGERSATTDASGAYRFADLAAGSYRVAHVAPAGWRRASGSAAHHDVTLASGQAAAGLNFANIEPVIITGEVFRDRDRNGQVGRRDRGLAGRTVFLDTDNDGVADAGERTAVTDAAGYFSFLDLDPGTYTVRVIRLAGETLTSPAGGAHSVTLLSGDTERLLFGLS